MAGALAAVFAAVQIHAVAITAPLFAQPRDVPSVTDSASSSQHAAAIERARHHHRARPQVGSVCRTARTPRTTAATISRIPMPAGPSPGSLGSSAKAT
jgi:hypothetical protein